MSMSLKLFMSGSQQSLLQQKILPTKSPRTKKGSKLKITLNFWRRLSDPVLVLAWFSIGFCCEVKDLPGWTFKQVFFCCTVWCNSPSLNAKGISGLLSFFKILKWLPGHGTWTTVGPMQCVSSAWMPACCSS